MANDEGILDGLGRRSSQLFLLGGVIVVVFAITEAVPAFSDSQFPVVRNVLTIGYALAFVGLIGQYRVLSEHQMWLARIGAAAAFLGAVGFTFNSIVSLVQLAGIVPMDAPTWTNAFVPLSIIGMVLGYLSMGTASLRSDVYSRRLGLVLLVPGIVFVVLLVGLFTVGIGQWAFIFSGTEAAAILGIGYLLRTESPPTGRTNP